MNIQITIDFRASDCKPVCVATQFNPYQPGAFDEVVNLASAAANDELGRMDEEERFEFTDLTGMIELCASCGWAVTVEVR